MHPVPHFGGLTAEVAPDRPGPITTRSIDNWESYEYKVRFAFEERRLTLPFRTGIGWTEAPTPAMVLTSYFDDARSGRDAADWQEFASEFGYEWQEDPASARKAQRIYALCLKADEQLRTLFAEHFEHAERVFTELERPAGSSASTSYLMRRSLGSAPENEHERALWRMQTVLDGYYDGEQPGAEASTAVRDLLTDVIHYCAANGVSFSDEIAEASRMVSQERDDWGMP